MPSADGTAVFRDELETLRSSQGRLDALQAALGPATGFPRLTPGQHLGTSRTMRKFRADGLMSLKQLGLMLLVMFVCTRPRWPM